MNSTCTCFQHRELTGSFIQFASLNAALPESRIFMKPSHMNHSCFYSFKVPGTHLYYYTNHTGLQSFVSSKGEFLRIKTESLDFFYPVEWDKQSIQSI